MSLVWLASIGVPSLRAAASATYFGSEYFSFTANDWNARVVIDDVSGALPVTLVQDFDFDGSLGLIEASAELGPSTSPSRVAQRSPIDSGTAIGRGRTEDASTATAVVLENIGDSSGFFNGNLGERIRITETSTLGFELEYDGSDHAVVNGVANICLMPIQLAVIEGAASATPAEAIFSYYLEIDGEEIYTSSMKLTLNGSGGIELTAPEGDLRTDGVFFEDPTYNTVGFNFPAIDLALPMSTWSDGDAFEGVLEFSTTIVADDDGWGGYAGPANSSVDPNAFIPSVQLIPEPGSVALLAIGLSLIGLRRRARSI